jgi:hypothetical protein
VKEKVKPEIIHCRLNGEETTSQTSVYDWYKSVLKTLKKIQLSASKIMASVFWDSGVMHVDSLLHDVTIHSDVHQVIQKKKSGKVSKMMILLQDNAHPHMADLATVEQEIMNYPPYSPKLASTDFHIFGTNDWI